MRLCLSPKTDADIISVRDSGYSIPFLIYYACFAEQGLVPALILKNVKTDGKPEKAIRVSIYEDPSLITPEIAAMTAGLSDKEKGRIYKQLFRKHILIRKSGTHKTGIDIASLLNN